jgi:hypothetical protein
LENWRLGNGDTALPDKENNITWYHENPSYADPHMSGFIFGGTIEGKGLVSQEHTTLQSARAATSQLISIYPLTTRNVTKNNWLSQLNKQVAKLNLLAGTNTFGTSAMVGPILASKLDIHSRR